MHVAIVSNRGFEFTVLKTDCRPSLFQDLPIAQIDVDAVLFEGELPMPIVSEDLQLAQAMARRPATVV